MDITSHTPARPESFDAARGVAQDKLRRGTLAQSQSVRPSTSLGTSEGQQAQLKAAAEAFEAVFLRQLIGSMRQAGLGEDILGSSATDQFRELSDSKLADQMAATGSFGIAEMLLTQLGGATK